MNIDIYLKQRTDFQFLQNFVQTPLTVVCLQPLNAQFKSNSRLESTLRRHILTTWLRVKIVNPNATFWTVCKMYNYLFIYFLWCYNFHWPSNDYGEEYSFSEKYQRKFCLAMHINTVYIHRSSKTIQMAHSQDGSVSQRHLISKLARTLNAPTAAVVTQEHSKIFRALADSHQPNHPSKEDVSCYTVCNSTNIWARSRHGGRIWTEGTLRAVGHFSCDLKWK